MFAILEFDSNFERVLKGWIIAPTKAELIAKAKARNLNGSLDGAIEAITQWDGTHKQLDGCYVLIHDYD